MGTVVIDTSVILHLIADWIDRNKDVICSPFAMEKVVKSQLVVMDSLSWLDGSDDYRCLWVKDIKDDSGKYWRQSWLDSNGYGRISYKAGRKPKSETFLMVSKIVEEFLTRYSHHVGCPGFEADDLVAALVKMNREKIVMVTVDTDWIGLVSDKVVWVNVHGRWLPRVRKDMESINKWAIHNRAIGNQELSKPSDIWAIKRDLGDKSDNLPPGSPLGVISLLNPAIEPPPIVTNYLANLSTAPRTKFSQEQLDYAQRLLRQCAFKCVIEPMDTKEFE